MNAKNSSYTVAIVILSLGVFVPSKICAQHGPGRHKPGSVEPRGLPYDLRSEATFKGTVAEVRMPGDKQTRVHETRVFLQIDTGTVEIYLGPTAFISEKNVEITTGDTLEVTGSHVAMGESQVVLAREVRKGGNMWTLRDAAGQPLWRSIQTETRGFWTKRRAFVAVLAAKVLVVAVMLVT